ncbi:MAG: hypothetical protein H0T46_02150 [Deltaproteobacteria bacterium]|nr:hypothetical protein [Deltaproteobacteria bacterium]
MLWRSGERIIVVQRGDALLVIDGDAVTRRLEPRTASDEDDLWRWEYLVLDSHLVERITIERGSQDARVHEQHTVVAELRAVDDAQTQQIVEAAMATDAVARAEHARSRELEGDARVAAIPHADDDLGAGADAERAQRALIERIHRWDDRRAAGLLRTLIELTRARVDPAVIAAYARGCLFACFAVESPEPVGAVPTVPNRPLAGAIEVHAAELEADAAGQEQADALRNAAALSRAATALRLAAALLS